MKEYKPTCCVTLLYFWGMMFVISFPLLVVAGAVAAEGQESFGQVFFGCIAALLVCGVVFALFAWLISGLVGLFARKTVLLSEDSVSYEGKTIQLDKIRYITLYLPELSKTRSKPQVLTVWADNKSYMEIKRPSIALIIELKKRCVFAAFDVDDWKEHLKQCLWVQLGIIGFGIVAYILGLR